VKPSHTRQGKRRRGAAWQTVVQNPEPPPARTETRLGIERRGDGRRKPPLPPMTSHQEAVLAALTDEPQRLREISRAAGVRSATSSLYALQGRGLAAKVGPRWKRGPR
jgi:hypothetical protein